MINAQGCAEKNVRKYSSVQASYQEISDQSKPPERTGRKAKGSKTETGHDSNLIGAIITMMLSLAIMVALTAWFIKNKKEQS